MVMLFPLRRIWSSLVILRPSGVSSLEQKQGELTNQQTDFFKETNESTYNSVTSSSTMSETLSEGLVLRQFVNEATGGKEM